MSDLRPPVNPNPPSARQPAGAARVGLVAIFLSTFLQLIGYFMLLPLLLLRLKGDGVSDSVAGLFAASGWAGIFLLTPLASWITHRIGRRPALWLAAAVPAGATLGFGLTDMLAFWFALELVAGGAAGLRWVLAEAVVAEFSDAGNRGRNIGLFETMVGSTFVIGPALLAAIGPTSAAALWTCLALVVAGLLASLAIPRLPDAEDDAQAVIGLRGVWHALRRHPIIMMAGFVGGFFESGVTSILPLFGLALGLSAVAAALLVSASGLGSTLMMLPVGMLADRWTDRAPGRRRMMVVLAIVTLLATCSLPFITQLGWLAWPIVFLWGGAGGSLYTLAMIDIGSREQGVTLVNSTAVLVLTYTLGSMTASASSGALLQWSPAFGFPALLAAVALLGCVALWRYQTKLP
ncbi:MAG: MFS transporter [Aquabacterium sp.]